METYEVNIERKGSLYKIGHHRETVDNVTTFEELAYHLMFFCNMDYQLQEKYKIGMKEDTVNGFEREVLEGIVRFHNESVELQCKLWRIKEIIESS